MYWLLISGPEGPNVYGDELAVLVRQGETVNAFCNAPAEVTGKKKALTIGLSYENGSPFMNSLPGTINDSDMFTERLQGQGWDVTQLTDREENVDKADVLSAFDSLVEGAVAGDVFMLFFSGHGTASADWDGLEYDGTDEFIVAGQYKKVNGFWDMEARTYLISDDEIRRHLIMPLPEGVKITLVFDACNSGTVVDMPFQYSRNTNTFEENKNPIYSPADVLVISGSRADQEAFVQVDGLNSELSMLLVETPFLFQDGGMTVDDFIAKADGKIGHFQNIQVTASQPSKGNRTVNYDGDIWPNLNKVLGRTINLTAEDNANNPWHSY